MENGEPNMPICSYKVNNRFSQLPMTTINISPHPRDGLIRFDAKYHTYTLVKTGVRFAKSVTGLKNCYFEPFDFETAVKNIGSWKNDPDSKYFTLLSAVKTDDIATLKKIIDYAWTLKGRNSAQKGTAMHAEIETILGGGKCGSSGEWDPETDIVKGGIGDKKSSSFTPLIVALVDEIGLCVKDAKTMSKVINGVNRDNKIIPMPWEDPVKADPREVETWKDWMSRHPELTILRTEWTVFSEKLNVAGQIDAVFKSSLPSDNGGLVIVDWKRTPNIELHSKFGKTAKAPFDKLPDTNFGQFSFQVNIYARILELHYDVKVSRMLIVQILPGGGRHETFNVESIYSRCA